MQALPDGKERGQDLNARCPSLHIQPLVLTIACAIQIVRIFHGIDFNDEMQYYGEIISLVNSGRLFSTDLFLQQTVYLLLYPVLKPMITLWGTENLIVVSRMLFAAYILWIYGRVRRRLVDADVGATAAAVSALALTLAVPMYNIYAFSYNTVALGVAAVCFAELFVWRRNGRAPSVVFWTVAGAVLLLVYPPLALGVGLVVMARLLIERDYRSLGRIAFLGCGAGLGIAWGVLQFTTIDDYIEAVAFTRAIGVGTAIFQAGLPVLVLLWCVLVAGIALDRLPIVGRAPVLGSRAAVLVSILVAVVSLFATRQAAIKEVWLATVVMALTGFVLTFCVASDEDRRTRTWLTVMFIAIGSVMVFTSGNGLKQIQGAAMLAAPFYFALASRGTKVITVPATSRVPGITAFGSGIVAVFVTLYIANPYQDEGVWRQHESADGVPAMRYIRITKAKAEAIALMRRTLSDIAPNSRVMIIGAHPWIYFATDTQPDTDMIFMHFTGGALAYRMLATRLAARQPEYLILAGPATAEVLAAAKGIADAGSYQCTQRPTDSLLLDAALNIRTYYNVLPALIVCHSGRKARAVERE